MLKPKDSTRRFDRNIFNGLGNHETIQTKKPLNLVFYGGLDTVVAEIEGTLNVITYWKFKRKGFIPVQIWHGNIDYCGWLREEDFEVMGV